MPTINLWLQTCNWFQSRVHYSRRPEELITQLVHLRYGSAGEVARVLQPMLSREAALTIHRDTNVLVITDSVEKLRRYLSVIRMLDVPTAQEQVQVFPLRFGDASSLAPLITQLVGGTGISGSTGVQVVNGKPHHDRQRLPYAWAYAGIADRVA